MRNLINLLWRFHHVLVFLLLETIAIALLVQNNRHQKAGFLNTTQELSGSVYHAMTNLTTYFELKQENDMLLAENAALKDQLRSSYFSLTAERAFTVDTVLQQQFDYISSKVVHKTTHSQYNAMTINVGKNNGVLPSMGVVGPEGVIGIVRASSSHYSAVLPIINKQSSIGTKIKGTNYFGSLTWEGSDPQLAKLNNIPSHVIIGEGDSLVTDGSSALFPEGIPVGTIQGFTQIPGTNKYTIEVKLATDFSNVSYAYVVSNLMKLEQKELEAPFEPDE